MGRVLKNELVLRHKPPTRLAKKQAEDAALTRNEVCHTSKERRFGTARDHSLVCLTRRPSRFRWTAPLPNHLSHASMPMPASSNRRASVSLHQGPMAGQA